MAFYNSRNYTTRGFQEILKAPAGFDWIRSVVVDSASITADSDGNRILKAGTILASDTAGPANQLVPFAAEATQKIQGILAYDIAAVDGTTKSDVPAAIFQHTAVFRKDRIIGYATHATALKAALPTCKFE